MAEKAAESDAACTEVGRGMTLVFNLLGKRWTGLIVAVLIPGPAHFADLRRAVPGISERMLSDRLTELAGARLVVREVDEGPPLRVSYRLTEAGEALGPSLASLGDWAEHYLEDVGSPCTAARAAARRATGDADAGC
ncbi:winged helix-turn-helix transcriptional regulator [Streptomyces sp. NPDC088923]|uniref:winged helix-turn-helix transcriptional regulator n=1 Tax=Streptomyces sp. NPDC088923 TaxID=3365913 RepID=UPI0038185C0D